MESKKCRSCRTNIPAHARVCPYCYKYQWSALIVTFFVVALFLTGLGAVTTWVLAERGIDITGYFVKESALKPPTATPDPALMETLDTLTLINAAGTLDAIAGNPPQPEGEEKPTEEATAPSEKKPVAKETTTKPTEKKTTKRTHTGRKKSTSKPAASKTTAPGPERRKPAPAPATSTSASKKPEPSASPPPEKPDPPLAPEEGKPDTASTAAQQPDEQAATATQPSEASAPATAVQSEMEEPQAPRVPSQPLEEQTSPTPAANTPAP